MLYSRSFKVITIANLPFSILVFTYKDFRSFIASHFNRISIMLRVCYPSIILSYIWFLNKVNKVTSFVSFKKFAYRISSNYLTRLIWESKYNVIGRFKPKDNVFTFFSTTIFKV